MYRESGTHLLSYPIPWQSSSPTLEASRSLSVSPESPMGRSSTTAAASVGRQLGLINKDIILTSAKGIRTPRG